MKQSPVRSAERKSALPLFPMLWNIMLIGTDSGWNSADTQAHLRATVPISITSGSSRNQVIIGRAKIMQTTANTDNRAAAIFTVKWKLSRTRLYFRAP